MLIYQEPEAFYNPPYKTLDLRFTLYWEPAVNTDENENGKACFYSAHFSTGYTVTVGGGIWSGKFLFYLRKDSDRTVDL